MIRVLLADDEELFCLTIARTLEKEGFEVVTAMDGQSALEQFIELRPHIVITDVAMPKKDGLALLKAIRASDKTVPVVVLTGSGTIQKAMYAMKHGAAEYLTKPFRMSEIVRVVNNLAEGIKHQHHPAEDSLHGLSERHELLGNSVQMQNVGKLIGAVAMTPNHTSILILGESGTGKELVARAIHRNSDAATEPFVAFNCAALPEHLLESELFGHEKGAFTGAVAQRMGKFEVAGAGVIFLDEIGELSLGLQQKFLRVLQEREFERIGGNTVLPVQARFVAATNKDLKEEVRAGRFREDLYYRLNVFPIKLPPLRERDGDVLMLAEHFLTRYATQMRKFVRGFSDEARSMLQAYKYPGNVRELENLIERAVALSQGQLVMPDALAGIVADYAAQAIGSAQQTIAAETVDENVVANDSPEPLQQQQHGFSAHHEDDTLANAHQVFERQFLVQHLTKHGGNVSEAATAAGMTRQNLYYLLKKYNLRAEEFRPKSFIP
jgi:two-component system response regulator AtoC